ncbi:MAG: 3'-5' exoribonuclease [Clostridia bacterium]
MKYLAFDIEAANGYRPYSICSIGIVIADENFTITHSENIWINPKTKYNLDGTRENVGINLHLDKDLIDASPDFTQVYTRVKTFLTDADTQVLGHAVESDVIMLNSACNHYKLPSINFSFMCSQLLFRLYKGEKEVRGLSKIADEIGLQFVQHNSEEDARGSMETLKFLVKETGLSPYELMAKYHIRMGSNYEFELTRTVSLDGQQSKKNLVQKAVSKIKSHIAVYKGANDGKLSGKTFAFARSMELDKAIIIPFIDTLCARGGSYTSKLSKANYYVSDGNESDLNKERERVVSTLQSGGKIQVLTINEFDLLSSGGQL